MERGRWGPGNLFWSGTDDLGRKLPTFEETGSPKTNRWVGLFYSLWHKNLRHIPGNFNMTEYLKTRPGFKDFTSHPPGGPDFPEFYWAEPLLGYAKAKSRAMKGSPSSNCRHRHEENLIMHHFSRRNSLIINGQNGGGGENRTPVRNGVTTASTCVSGHLISLRALPTGRPPPQPVSTLSFAPGPGHPTSGLTCYCRLAPPSRCWWGDVAVN